MKLILKKDADVCLFLLSEGENQSFIITGDEKIETEYEEKRISPNDSISVVKTGISCLHIKNTGEESEIDFSYSAGISPFIVPGPGIMPRDRLDKQTFWFPADFAGQFYIYVPEHTGNVCFSTYSGYASDDAVVFSLQPDNGKSVLNRWLPEKKKRAPWQTCEENGNGWWCARKIRGGQDFRVSEWNGLVVFFKKPECDVPYSYLIPENTQKKDYRICIIRNGHMESAQDILYSEKVRIPFIAGTVDVISSAGYCFSEQKTQLHAVQGESYSLPVEFTETISVPDGWVRGDCHVHSVFEDACCFPARITKSGRCNGLDFVFSTDHGGKTVLENGLKTYEELGRFLPIPGQECVNVRTHMNFLNVDFNIDYKDKTEAEWIEDAKRKAKRPYLMMLNHPSHLPHVMSTPWGDYFRSWWVATACPEITLVENFDFITWFDHLNRGRKLIGIWTSDTHDGTWQRPGDACCFVYTAGKLDENSILKAMEKGHVVNTLLPGAFLTLQLNGKMVGDTVDDNGEKMCAEISCASNTPMDRIDLVFSGRVIKSWDMDGKKKAELTYSFSVPDVHPMKKKWVLAVMYVKDGDFRRDIDSQMESDNVRAYTNPIYIK